MRIQLVKKQLADGTTCRKCQDVDARLTRDDHWRHIDEVIVADEADPTSPGMRLAEELGIDRAPFFVVNHDDGRREVHTVYFKFVRDVLGGTGNRREADRDLLDANPGLDLL